MKSPQQKRRNSDWSTPTVPLPRDARDLRLPSPLSHCVPMGDREPGDAPACASQDFVPLPGGEDQHEAGSLHPRVEPVKPREESGEKRAGNVHGILEHGTSEVLGSSSKWGVEGLLGPTAAANSGKGFAASAKNTIVSGLERLTAARGRPADDGVEQPCEYVAMSTPCESPVNKVRQGAPRTLAKCVPVCVTSCSCFASTGSRCYTPCGTSPANEPRLWFKVLLLWSMRQDQLPVPVHGRNEPHREQHIPLSCQ